jgi:hypothetical protein
LSPFNNPAFKIHFGIDKGIKIYVVSKTFLSIKFWPYCIRVG